MRHKVRGVPHASGNNGCKTILARVLGLLHLHFKLDWQGCGVPLHSPVRRNLTGLVLIYGCLTWRLGTFRLGLGTLRGGFEKNSMGFALIRRALTWLGVPV